MKVFGDILLDSLIDGLKILPILLAVYFLIGFFEYKQATKFEKLRFLNKRTSSFYGALFGSLPQCGFSVVASDLYSKRKINIGALIAVYIATSDEALPIMLTSVKSLKAVLPLIVVKIAIAIFVGMISQILFEKIFKTKTTLKESKVLRLKTKTHETKLMPRDIKSDSKEDKFNEFEDSHHKEDEDHHSHEEENEQNVSQHLGCCHHGIEKHKYDWKHPIMHSLKIIGVILLINVIFGCIIEYGFKGEENLASFLTQKGTIAIQPIIAMFIGFIPNCASSVVLTELYLINGISFGALLAGLIVNAGLGLILLFKENKHVKENIFIVLVLIVTSLIFGYGIHFLV